MAVKKKAVRPVRKPIKALPAKPRNKVAATLNRTHGETLVIELLTNILSRIEKLEQQDNTARIEVLEREHTTTRIRTDQNRSACDSHSENMRNFNDRLTSQESRGKVTVFLGAMHQLPLSEDA